MLHPKASSASPTKGPDTCTYTPDLEKAVAEKLTLCEQEKNEVSDEVSSSVSVLPIEGIGDQETHPTRDSPPHSLLHEEVE
ncbi:hypothetical protein SCP_0604580 [Sparassis crispa]|uniref:Uncharacterized protein n=1 Tax=Sparassis crispa TaxID=139825 RepID=A0A401GQP2_9APHY|nr:hypothetical protein SCP_0604580 [Sparassis crispa]GBE84479.1 hypothetical protein SCP_0604580 [Sparassis crispa]